MQKDEKGQSEKIKKQDWNAGEIAEEATNKPEDEVMREMLRGDETQGNPDDRDVVGGVDSDETPHGSEEAKKNNTEKE